MAATFTLENTHQITLQDDGNAQSVAVMGNDFIVADDKGGSDPTTIRRYNNAGVFQDFATIATPIETTELVNNLSATLIKLISKGANQFTLAYNNPFARNTIVIQDYTYSTGSLMATSTLVLTFTEIVDDRFGFSYDAGADEYIVAIKGRAGDILDKFYLYRADATETAISVADADMTEITSNRTRAIISDIFFLQDEIYYLNTDGSTWTLEVFNGSTLAFVETIDDFQLTFTPVLRACDVSDTVMVVLDSDANLKIYSFGSGVTPTPTVDLPTFTLQETHDVTAENDETADIEPDPLINIGGNASSATLLGDNVLIARHTGTGIGSTGIWEIRRYDLQGEFFDSADISTDDIPRLGGATQRYAKIASINLTQFALLFADNPVEFGANADRTKLFIKEFTYSADSSLKASKTITITLPFEQDSGWQYHLDYDADTDRYVIIVRSSGGYYIAKLDPSVTEQTLALGSGGSEDNTLVLSGNLNPNPQANGIAILDGKVYIGHKQTDGVALDVLNLDDLIYQGRIDDLISTSAPVVWDIDTNANALLVYQSSGVSIPQFALYSFAEAGAPDFDALTDNVFLAPNVVTGREIGTYTATSTETLTYSLTGQNATLFAIDSSTGEVTVDGTLVNGVRYVFNVVATDTSNLTGVLIVIVEVRETANPVFPRKRIVVEMQPDPMAGTLVGRFPAQSPDTTNILYSFTGTDSTFFGGNADAVRAGPNLVNGQQYTFNLVATSEVTGLTDTLELVIFVLPVFNNPFIRTIPFTLPTTTEKIRSMEVSAGRIYLLTVIGDPLSWFLRTFEVDGTYLADESFEIEITNVSNYDINDVPYSFSRLREPSEADSYFISLGTDGLTMRVWRSGAGSPRAFITYQDNNLADGSLVYGLETRTIGGIRRFVRQFYVPTGTYNERQATIRRAQGAARSSLLSTFDGRQAIVGDRSHWRYEDWQDPDANLRAIYRQDQPTKDITEGDGNRYVLSGFVEDVDDRLFRYVGFSFQERLGLPAGVTKLRGLAHNNLNLWACDDDNFYTSRPAGAPTENAPEFLDDTRTINLQAGAEQGDIIGTVTANDRDTGAILRYRIASTQDFALFFVNPVNGVLTLNADLQNGSTYEFIVIAADQLGFTASQQITVNVGLPDVILPAPNRRPSFDGNFDFTISANPRVGFRVGVVAATDLTSGVTIAYSLSGTDAALFDIESDSGLITVAATLTNGESYTFIVTATDSNGTINGVSVTVMVSTETLPEPTPPPEPEPPPPPPISQPDPDRDDRDAVSEVDTSRRIGRGMRAALRSMILRWKLNPTQDAATLYGWVTQLQDLEESVIGITIDHNQYEVIIPDVSFRNVGRGDIFFTEFGKQLTVEDSQIFDDYLRFICVQTGGV